MVTLNRIPPAQAEALYDATLDKNWNAPERAPGSSEAHWPGEDWDDEGEFDGEAGAAKTSRSLSPRYVSARA